MDNRYTSIKVKAWLLAIIIFAAAGLIYFNNFGFDGGYTLYIEKAASAEEDNNYKRAYKYYAKAAKKAPLSSNANIGASNMLVLLDRSEDAVNTMEAFISDGTASKDAYDELIELYEITDTDYAKIINLLDNAADLFDEDYYKERADRYRDIASTVCAPILSHSSGSYNEPITVEITNQNKKLNYYYSIDSEVDLDSNKYDGKFKVENTCTVNLAAFDSDGNASTVSYYNYLIGSKNDDNTLLLYNNNSVNSGVSAAYKDYIYYTLDRNLYRTSTVKEKPELLLDACAYSVSFCDDELFFIDADNRFNIYKCDPDGDNLKCIAPDSASVMHIYKGSVYYINKSDNNTLYKCSVSGRDTEKLLDLSLNSLNIYNDRIYYSTDTGLYRCRLDGTHSENLVSTGTDEVYVHDDKLYYISHVTRTFSSTSLNGGSQTIIFGEPTEQALICNSGIFYTPSDSDGLFRYDFYKKESEQLTSNNCGRLSLANERILYFDYTQKLLYSLTSDGISKSVIKR